MKPIVETSFNIEQDIMHCWSIVDDIETLSRAVMEQDMSKDRIVNVLIGLKELYNLRFDHLLKRHEELHRQACES